MIIEIIQLMEQNALPLNFICHLTIFFGGYYVALHCRALPNWVSTSLWYIGLASLLTLMTIIFEWIYGPSFELSYTRVGLLGETISHIMLAVTVGVLFFHTVIKDMKGMKSRGHKEKL